VLENFLTTGSFPPKHVWKRMVHDNVNAKMVNDMQCSISSDQTLSRYSGICNLGERSVLWELGRRYPKSLLYCKTTVHVLGKMFSAGGSRTILCVNCNMYSTDLTEHLVIDCKSSERSRHMFWNQCYALLGKDLFRRYTELPIKKQIDTMFGGLSCFPPLQRDSDSYLLLSVKYVHIAYSSSNFVYL